jgi:2-C-methyl-D-erythritol 4-phosphate cytidylyltransferase
MKAAVIIVAAGKGKRFGSDTPKQFLNLKGKNVFLWSVLAFNSLSIFKEIIVIVPQNMLSILSRKYKNLAKLKFVAGGKERFDSVKNGIALIGKDIDFIAIHDGVRPLIAKSDILKVLNRAKIDGVAIAVEKTKDTIKEVKNGFIVKTLDRSKLYNAQTPQIFRKDLLLKAYNRKVPPKTTDDVQLLESLKIKTAIVETEFTNFKITTKQDLEFAKKILASKIVF